VLSTDYKSSGEQYMGNWALKNFVNFIYNKSKKTGLLTQNLFTNFKGNKTVPCNNFVIYDYSTIPNEHPFPECNWKLGNNNY